MADPVIYGNSDRDIEQALVTLKKGTQLIKYSRKGKPKFRAFRVSPDETSLIWLSHGEEKNLKLSSVSRIIPGQRTAVFRRFLRPEKDYLSFSLLYNNGDRTLDLICKDKVEAEVWLAGLKALIGRNRGRRTRSDISDLTDGGDLFQNGRTFGATLDISSSLNRGRVSIDLGPRDTPLNTTSSDAGSERANMQLRTSGGGDGFRISVSSTPSCSSGGSGPDDIESLGDVYLWGEVWSDVVLPDGSLSSIPLKNDVLTPKPLESNVVLDVQQIACGVRHVGLVTRQGEVFTWGEESGGRLGHGMETDFSCPRLVEFLAVTNVDYVACGEYHTCAISTSGDLYTWGDGKHNAGLLGQGTDVSHWIPKRVSSPLEGLQVLSIACGTWHSALATSNGKLFTFGDGAFGVLGHGDRESVAFPKEVQLLSGLKTIKVACGLWHTAAIVEVMSQAGSNVSSRKLFTWGDGDKHRLGHGSKDTYLLPTCVSTLIDYNFYQIACGHTLTVALTTSGHVFTMGGTAHGQLGNPSSDGKVPSLVQDNLVGEFVEEVSCGAYHVAVLTSRSELYTWGKGANGRLGHGDTEDRRIPTLVEALRDRHVKNISCGSNFTTSICIHKWVSGADQSVCSGCRQAFGFTRKRHNCYNCGLVHCHACSSKKALKAALAPTPGKPHRVCDACYAKLKTGDTGSYNINRKVTTPRRSIDSRERMDRGESRPSRTLLSPTTEPIKYLEIKSGRPGMRTDSSSIVRASQVPNLLQLKDISFPSSLSAIQNTWKPIPSPIPPSPINSPQPISNSRPVSPYSRRPSPPRSVTPGFSRSVIDSLKKTNEILKLDMTKMQNQMKSVKQKCDAQDIEILRLQKQAKETALLATSESSKSKEAKKLVKSIAEQLKEMTEQLPPDVQEMENFKAVSSQIETFLHTYGASKSASLTESSSSVSSLKHTSDTTRDKRLEDRASELPHNGNALQDSHRLSVSSSRNTEADTIVSKKEGESIEQFEAGVYVTFVQRSNGVKLFKRVKFSKRRFQEQQAEMWWKDNKDRLLRRYSPPGANAAIGSSSTPASPSAATAAAILASSTSQAEDISEGGQPSETS
ncbi:PH, RCC1 and FYVE domains-containing protein 1 [Mercurialis annua]|uniref:PH, RCC1 and FYVE domains-containing protein 1 n=1 Tax=Mercurialis annua TaxID=3986 RepID=UPI0021606E69|nr:PH, RCC1 and FYVE domains-containing protein 1 [Mercurialis annua]XP_050218625.1 PH, RCC1 and FYVE domains-containing protein 1 [Mercurialis annua]